MDKIEELLGGNFNVFTSYRIDYQYKEYLKEIQKNINIFKKVAIAGVLKSVIVTEGINILNGEKLQKEMYKKSMNLYEGNSIMVKINKEIEQIVGEVTAKYFTSKSHFVRYAILRYARRNNIIINDGSMKAKIIYGGKLF